MKVIYFQLLSFMLTTGILEDVEPPEAIPACRHKPGTGSGRNDSP